MVWSWSSIATTSKSSLVPPRYHCPTIGLITCITASVCYAQFNSTPEHHSTPNESVAQYVFFARSNIASDRTARQILRRLLRRGRPDLTHSTVRGPHAGRERTLQEKNGRQGDRDRVGDMRAVRVGGCKVPGRHGDIPECIPYRGGNPAVLDRARHGVRAALGHPLDDIR